MGLDYAWYGDDFTGSTDVLESLAEAGVPALLFLHPPTPDDIERHPGLRAIGVAGDSRSRPPEWMDEYLPGIFASLKALGAPVTHYKTCSTFDSAPGTGSIGRALEIGLAAFGGELIPIVVGAPHLRRYQLFGTLFAAASDGLVYRIDRHPTMSHHPVTPMREADLRRHLAAQTDLPIGLIDLPTLQGFEAERLLERLRAEGVAAVLIDVADNQSLTEAGHLIARRAQTRQLFAVGSSGVTRALCREWRRNDSRPPKPLASTLPTDRLLVVSGSCSPATADQIGWALANGFHGTVVDVAALVAGDEAYAAKIVADAVGAFSDHAGVLIYTTIGPAETPGGGDPLGIALGRVTRAIVRASGVRRVLVAGGDTSSHAIAQLDIDALGCTARFVVGAPLCRSYGADPERDGLELILKGGQIGGPDLFGSALGGMR